jgi:hypothetical protein
MQKARGFGGHECEATHDLYTNIISSGLKKLIHHKYGDIVILLTLTAAFGMLLAASING